MKSLKLFAVLGLAVILSVAITACNPPPVEPSPSPEPSPVVATAEPIVTAKPDTAAKVDDLLGKWVFITDSKDWVTITKTSSGYQYENSSGKYAATFKNGALIAKSGGVTLTAKYNTAKKLMEVTLSDDPGGLAQYKKK